MTVPKLSSYRQIKIRLNNFNTVFGHMMVGKIKSIDIENYEIKREHERIEPGTLDNETGTVKSMVTKAFDNGMIDGRCLKAFRKTKKLLKSLNVFG